VERLDPKPLDWLLSKPAAAQVSPLPSRTHLVKSIFLLAVLLASVLGGTGCSSVSARKVIALDRFHRVFVERRLNDNHRLDEHFVAALQRLGYQASSGPLTMMPEKTDALLTYDARWEWDFQSYLIELTLEVHTVHPRKKLADARSHQPTMTPKSPAAVVRNLVDRLFGK